MGGFLRAWIAVAALAASCAYAQQTPAPIQRPPLSVDADPVPSPDGATIAVPAQGATAPLGEVMKDKGGFTISTSTYEVRLNASVIDGSGRPVDSLPASAFHIYEDGTPQTLVGFRHEDVPVSLGILIDSSGSMYDKRDAVSAAALDLVRLSNPQDEAFFVDFNDEAYIDQDFTSDIKKLEKGLGYIDSKGGTALYDAVVASANHLSEGAHRPKQVILLVTDGDDDASTTTLEAAIRRVQELDGPAIYSIGLLFGEDVPRSVTRHSREVLTELAQQTGGMAYFPKSIKDVDGIAREVAADIRTQYTLAYRSTKPPSLGGYRTIHVTAQEKGFRNLEVRTRAGYFPKVDSKPGAASPPSQ